MQLAIHRLVKFGIRAKVGEDCRDQVSCRHIAENKDVGRYSVRFCEPPAHNANDGPFRAGTHADDVRVGVCQPALHAVAIVKMPGTNIPSSYFIYRKNSELGTAPHVCKPACRPSCHNGT